MSAGVFIPSSSASPASRADDMRIAEAIGTRALLWLQSAMWLGLFIIFFCSPVLQMSDSQYTMLTADSIIHHHTPDLSSYRIKNYRADLPFDIIEGRNAYQLARVNGRLLYGFGHGTSILSIPFVAAMEVFGISPAAEGAYDLKGEAMVEKLLASVLMASLVIIFFYTALLMLDWRWSALVALGAGLGTSVWSTASRGMWAHTWEIVLGAIVVFILLESALRHTSIRPILLATLLSWMFFVRPDGAIAVLVVGVYVLVRRPRDVVAFAFAGALWLVAFVAYSMRFFGTIVPFYYLSNDPHGLGIHFVQGMYGELLSPSRGIFVFSPVFGVVLYLVARYWRSIADHALAIAAIAVFAGITVASAAHPEWWGGMCYGPRLLCDAMPWLILLAIFALAAMPQVSRSLRSPVLGAGAAMLLLSIAINAYGAFSMETLAWNFKNWPPREAMLNWSHPQFLAGWVDPPDAR